MENKITQIGHRAIKNFNVLNMSFTKGMEFFVVNDVVYMNGYPLAAESQRPVSNYINGNPSTFERFKIN